MSSAAVRVVQLAPTPAPHDVDEVGQTL